MALQVSPKPTLFEHANNSLFASGSKPDESFFHATDLCIKVGPGCQHQLETNSVKQSTVTISASRALLSAMSSCFFKHKPIARPLSADDATPNRRAAS
jgi:hypothetical protein